LGRDVGEGDALRLAADAQVAAPTAEATGFGRYIVSLLLVAVAALAGVVFAIVVMIVIYRAMSNLIDWLILTFGNADAVARLKRDRVWSSEDE
jgi:F0F1-type ATP synthase membrane subunit c/vacuolar-type H+-ATPase subunit K